MGAGLVSQGPWWLWARWRSGRGLWVPETEVVAVLCGVVRLLEVGREDVAGNDEDSVALFRLELGVM